MLKIQIRIRMDPDHFEKPDPDPDTYQSEMPDLDTHQSQKGV
jgi:hypothetical protein